LPPVAAATGGGLRCGWRAPLRPARQQRLLGSPGGDRPSDRRRHGSNTAAASKHSDVASGAPSETSIAVLLQPSLAEWPEELVSLENRLRCTALARPPLRVPAASGFSLTGGSPRSSTSALTWGNTDARLECVFTTNPPLRTASRRICSSGRCGGRGHVVACVPLAVGDEDGTVTVWNVAPLAQSAAQRADEVSCALILHFRDPRSAPKACR
jgi:hypothetical protein